MMVEELKNREIQVEDCFTDVVQCGIRLGWRTVIGSDWVKRAQKN